MSNALAWFTAHWGVISAVAAFLLANFVTAATQHPDVVPSNVLHLVQFAAQFVSMLTHSGSDSTFKLPFTVQAAPGTASLSIRGFARLSTLAFLVIACLGLSACSFFSPSIKADLAACGAAVTKDVQTQVAASLLTGGSAWQSDLYKLADKVGNDGLACAINVALKDFAAQHAAEPAPAPALSGIPPTPDVHVSAIARGNTALTSLGASPH